MFSFVIGYFHEILWILSLMYIFHCELWRFKVVVTVTLFYTDVAKEMTTFKSLELRILPLHWTLLAIEEIWFSNKKFIVAKHLYLENCSSLTTLPKEIRNLIYLDNILGCIQFHSHFLFSLWERVCSLSIGLRIRVYIWNLLHFFYMHERIIPLNNLQIYVGRIWVS